MIRPSPSVLPQMFGVLLTTSLAVQPVWAQPLPSPTPNAKLAPSAPRALLCDTAKLVWTKGRVSDRHNRWYSRQLCAMGEGPLPAPRTRDAVTLRLIWIPTFFPAFMVRIDHAEGKTMLTAVELDGAGGYEPGKIAGRVSQELSDKEWQAVLDILEADKLRELPQHPVPAGLMDLDGIHYVFEMKDGTGHHIVERDGGDELLPLGRHLVELTEW